MPKNHFDGVESHGFVDIYDNIGEVEIDEDIKLPLIINFRSDRNALSPYLGKGWVLALFESSMVQREENTFLMLQPDGWINRFQRNPKNPSLLDGSAGWKAEIRGDIISAWAPCGWKIIFNKGKIFSISTPGNRVIDFVYNGDKLQEIREAGSVRLSVEYATSGMASSLVTKNSRLNLENGQKPQIQSLLGKNIIGNMDLSYCYVTGSHNTIKTFSYAVNNSIQPTISIVKEGEITRTITWDPLTKLVISDNDWKYKIESPKEPTASIPIERQNSAKQKEYWFRDSGRGILTARNADGTEKVLTWFTTGLLNGKKRYTILKKPNNPDLKESFFYDEQGNLVRKQIQDLTYEYKNNLLTKIKTDKSEYEINNNTQN